MVGEHWQKTEIGSPQGGVIRPLIANIYLDAFDREMRKREHRVVRYADDILIFCRSEGGAGNALAQATKIAGERAETHRNNEITYRAQPEAWFFGVEIGSRYTRIQTKKLVEFKKVQADDKARCGIKHT
ncbi:reverse transcriptase domain-containing protein [Vibrio splendidus]